MTQPYDPNQPPPYGAPAQPYGAPPPPPTPPPYGAPAYGGYGPPPGQRINDPAPMGTRFLGRLIDIVLGLVVISIVQAALGIHTFHSTHTSSGTSFNWSVSGSDYIKSAIVTLVVWGLYEVIMTATRGQTLGKMAVGVRVADLQTGQTPTVQAALVRWVIPGVAGAVTVIFAGIIFLSPFFDSTRRNRGWYDYAAKTIAVRTR